MTALSVHAYAYLSDRYRLLPHGASMGERYGPDGGGRGRRIDPADLPRLRVAIPGLLTSAFLQLQLAVGRIADPVIMPFDRILDVVEAGEVDAGLVIHEGQLTYATQGLRSILDLGEWWHELTGGLPLPLGANAVRRDLDEGDTLPRLSRLLRESIAYGLEHRTGALAHAERFGRGLDRGARRPVRGHVRQRPHPRLRRGRPGRGGRAAAPRARGRPDRPAPVRRLRRGLSAMPGAGRDWEAEIDRWTERFRSVADPPEPFATALREGWTDGGAGGPAPTRRRPTPRRHRAWIEQIGCGRDGPGAPGLQGGILRRLRRATAAAAYSLAGETEGLPPPPPLPICPACRHTLNLLTPFFMQSLGLDIDDLIAESQPYSRSEARPLLDGEGALHAGLLVARDGAVVRVGARGQVRPSARPSRRPAIVSLGPAFTPLPSIAKLWGTGDVVGEHEGDRCRRSAVRVFCDEGELAARGRQSTDTVGAAAGAAGGGGRSRGRGGRGGGGRRSLGRGGRRRVVADHRR